MDMHAYGRVFHNAGGGGGSWVRDRVDFPGSRVGRVGHSGRADPPPKLASRNGGKIGAKLHEIAVKRAELQKNQVP